MGKRKYDESEAARIVIAVGDTGPRIYKISLPYIAVSI